MQLHRTGNYHPNTVYCQLDIVTTFQTHVNLGEPCHSKSVLLLSISPRQLCGPLRPAATAPRSLSSPPPATAATRLNDETTRERKRRRRRRLPPAPTSSSPTAANTTPAVRAFFLHLALQRLRLPRLRRRQRRRGRRRQSKKVDHVFAQSPNGKQKWLDSTASEAAQESRRRRGGLQRAQVLAGHELGGHERRQRQQLLRGHYPAAAELRGLPAAAEEDGQQHCGIGGRSVQLPFSIKDGELNEKGKGKKQIATLQAR